MTLTSYIEFEFDRIPDSTYVRHGISTQPRSVAASVRAQNVIVTVALSKHGNRPEFQQSDCRQALLLMFTACNDIELLRTWTF